MAGNDGLAELVRVRDPAGEAGFEWYDPSELRGVDTGGRQADAILRDTNTGQRRIMVRQNYGILITPATKGQPQSGPSYQLVIDPRGAGPRRVYLPTEHIGPERLLRVATVDGSSRLTGLDTMGSRIFRVPADQPVPKTTIVVYGERK